MPIIQSTTVYPSDFIATNVPVNGQVPSKNADGTFTWVENSSAVAQTELTEYIINKQTRGFTDLSKFTITLTGAEKDTLTLTDLGAGYDFYLNGTLYHETGNRTLALTGGAGNPHTSGLWYFYSDTTDLVLKVKSAPFNYTGNEIMIASVEWNGSLPSGSRSLLSLESHTSLIDARVHSYLHFTRGYQLVFGGGELSGYKLLSGLKEDKQFSVASARCYDEDLIHILDALAGGDGKYCNYYRTGVGVWGWNFDENYPFRIAASPSARVLYDDGAGGSEATSISYMNIYEILTNVEGQARHIFVSSQKTYDTVEESYSASFSDLDLTGFPVSERVVSHKITIEVNDDTVGDGHCYYERISNYTVSPSDLSPSTIGAPSLVEGSTIDNLVSFASAKGGQKDSGFSPSSFQLVSGKNAANGYAGLDASKNISLQTGGIKDAVVTTAVKLGDSSNTSLTTVNKTILGSINEIESELSYLSAGVFGTEPTFIDNGNGTATIGDVDILLYSSDDFTGTLKEYIVTGDTFLFTVNSEEYVVVDYNAGTPIMKKITDISLINSSSIFRLFSVWRVGNVCHSLGFDALGRGLSNKLQDSETFTSLYERSVDGGLDISETLSPNPRTVLVNGADIYVGASKQVVSAFDSSTDTMTEIVHSSSAWLYANKLVYNNSEYDPGTNATALGSGKYGVVWFYRSIGDIKQVFYVLGTQAYDTESLALLAQPRTDLPIMVKRHCILIGRGVILSGAASGNIQSAFGINFVGYSAMSHNDMVNIQGGTTAQYYHLTSAQNTAVGNLSTMSTQASNNVSITGGIVSGITDLAVLDGGTGASDAGTARSNLGLGTISTQASNSVSITGGAISGTTITGTASLDLPLAGGTLTGKLITAASGASGAGLNLTPGSIPSSPANGDFWNSTLQKAISAYIGGIRENLVGCIYTKIDSTVINAATAGNNETTLLSVGTGTLTIPADFLKIGKTIRIKASGILTTSSGGSPTIVMKFKLGNNILAANTAFKPGASLTNVQWFVDGEFTVRAIGAGTAGNIIGQGLWRPSASTTTFSNIAMLNTAVVTFDSTITNTLDVTATYSAGTAGNTITCTGATIEFLN